MNEPFQLEDNLYLTINKWKQSNPNLKVGFTTRNGGVSKPPRHSLNLGLHVHDHQEDVLSNRRLLADKIEMPLDNWVSGQQVHDTKVLHVNAKNKGSGASSYDTSLSGIDGIITKDKGILCTAFYADCVPIFFFDPVSEYIGIAHAGWKGTVQQISRKMVEAFKKQNVRVENLEIVIGPSISKDKYVVDHNVIQHIDEKYMKKTVKSIGENQYLLNLKQLNAEILLQSGVLRNNIDITQYCTYTHDSLFFSHRRDKGKTGRMLGFIGFSE
ncbi:peptidoglycan editing factor PgeF [Ornithinibacillus halophilus]|uniref:Purine nucleoside phosphorylase n=1 Tax=Ornithinibacillus halophilus TaxID=930117 RepID=A0A1M5C4U4_9BACI|nr:peptidoglycan editing factor PgeF [Ornithinibacillus halophilus]SHF49721.1 conserved hypothetical protein [Ornithinibacillus halophilus]